MSDLTEAIVMSGGFFVLMLITQFGTRTLSMHRILASVGVVVGVGASYFGSAPTDGRSLAVYVVGIGIGLVFAGLATASTRSWIDASTGKRMTRSGIAFLAVWATAMLMRVAFVWAVSDNATFRTWFGEQMATLHLTPGVIAPFFVLWALTMVGGRVAALLWRTRRPQALRTA
ncbi:hypothetical protein [uncultured Williamsia sp.]|uniref:hypothetical protein n=1 Tax=uncultured Williamsia sp. TaxID=259311 RepID=UPI00260D197F|nr:hypothetical protein [uncultured Williamsia sp.]